MMARYARVGMSQEMDDARCDKCYKKANKLCPDCQFGSYCSEKCRTKHLPLHKYICFKEQHKRIEGYVNYCIDYRHVSHISLSNAAAFKLNPINRGEVYAGAMCCICIINNCQAVERTRIGISYGGIWVYAYRCDPCLKKDYRLCSTTWMERGRCLVSGSNYMLYIMVILGEFLPRDLVNTLSQLIISLKKYCDHNTIYNHSFRCIALLDCCETK
jgi:hypothetical protein